MFTALTDEQLLTAAQLAATVPPARNGRRTHLSTILRWITRGARSPSGERVRLEAVRIGGRWLTSREAFARFAERLTPSLDTAPASPPPPRSAAKRRRASERAAKELARRGV